MQSDVGDNLLDAIFNRAKNIILFSILNYWSSTLQQNDFFICMLQNRE